MKFPATTYKILYWIVIFFGVASVVISTIYLPLPVLDWQLLILSFITIFFSSKLHFQLPKTKIHFSVADVLILFAVLNYGGTAAIFLALFESLFTSYSFKRKGISIKPRTFVLNAAIHTLSVSITAMVVYYLFTPLENVINSTNYNSIVFLILTMCFMQYAGNSTLVAIFAAERSGKSVWQTWNETYINLGFLYLAESMLAVISYKLINQTNLFMVLVVFGLAAIVYITYRRYVDEIKQTSALAEQAERERAESEKLRAEQAEKYVLELKKLLDEQARTGTELLESKNLFRHAAFHDNLTDLPNRNSVVESLLALYEISRANSEYKFSVLYIDLNSFKHINDSLGYPFGDQILKQVAKRLSNIVTDGTIVARFGSDEFAVVMNENAGEENAVDLANRIHQKISEPFSLQGRQIFTTPCIGIANSSPHYEIIEDILRDAEIAMYQAKHTQKTFIIFNRSMHDSLLERIEIENDLRLAIERKEFCLYYQPIVDLETVQIIGFEALVRWYHPQKGIIAPYKFIPVAEDTGLIIPMTEWILREACRQVKIWQTDFNSDLSVSVNISGKHFAQSNLINLVEKVLTETQFTPEKLKLEITESAVMEDAEKAIAILQQLKMLGVKLMIDDFGTGYSSLNYLHKFPIDTLKVDRSFINTMENAEDNNEIVKTIILMAKNLRLDVVAEGIESINQLDQLRKLRCEKGQGYFFSKPVTDKQIENLLQHASPWQNIIQTQNIPFIPQSNKSDAENLKIN
jgi:diguanylate cyclase (GGDEF)-like protein